MLGVSWPEADASSMPAQHQFLFAEIGNLEVVEHRAGQPADGLARADPQVIASRRKADARVHTHAERLDALSRLGPEGQIEHHVRVPAIALPSSFRP